MSSRSISPQSYLGVERPGEGGHLQGEVGGQEVGGPLPPAHQARPHLARHVGQHVLRQPRRLLGCPAVPGRVVTRHTTLYLAGSFSPSLAGAGSMRRVVRSGGKQAMAL